MEQQLQTHLQVVGAREEDEGLPLADLHDAREDVAVVDDLRKRRNGHDLRDGAEPEDIATVL